MELIKNVGYGIVTKSIKLQVFMTPERYMEVVNEARVYKISSRSDSELICKVLEKFLHEMPILVLERDRMKEAILKKNSVIETLRTEIAQIKGKKVKK